MGNTSGITYYNLISEYSGDTTKNCGLTINDMDNNFHFLRGEGIFSIEWDRAKCCFIIKKLNGEVIESDAVSKYISESIIAAINGVTADVQQLEDNFSAVTESLEAVYGEIDMQISGVTNYVNEDSERLKTEMQESSDYLTNYVDGKVNGVMRYVRELSRDINCRFECLEKRVGRLEEIVNEQ